MAEDSAVNARQDQPVRTTLSERVQEWADGDRITRMLDEIEGLEKKVWLDCPKCNKRSLMDVPDDVRKLEALLKVIEQTEGRPGTVDGEPGGVTIIVERTWPVGSDDSDSEPLQATADTSRVPSK